MVRVLKYLTSYYQAEILQDTLKNYFLVFRSNAAVFYGILISLLYVLSFGRAY